MTATPINTLALAKIGFTLIRGLLDGRLPGGPTAALDLAEALHNLPEPDNAFLADLTLRNITDGLRSTRTSVRTLRGCRPVRSMKGGHRGVHVSGIAHSGAGGSISLIFGEHINPLKFSVVTSESVSPSHGCPFLH